MLYIFIILKKHIPSTYNINQAISVAAFIRANDLQIN